MYYNFSINVILVLFFCGIVIMVNFSIQRKYFSLKMPNGEYACAAIVNDITDQKREQEALRASAVRFSKVFQFGPQMMTIVRMSDNTFVDANRRFLKAKGLSLEEVIGKRPTEIGVSESVFKQFLDTLETDGAVQNLESPMVMTDGSVGTVILSAEKIQIDDQDCILFAYDDITEMKRMQMETTEQLTKNLKLEQDLARSNQLISDTINTMQDGFFVLDEEWNFTYVNKRVEELFLKTREELLDQSFWGVFPHAREKLFELYQQVKKDGVPATFEIFGTIHQGKWFQVTSHPYQSGLSVYYKDITEQKLSREKLMKAQEEKADILESMTDCFFTIDRNWQVTYINHAAEIAFGKSRDELLNKKITKFSLNDTALLHYHEVMSDKRSVTFEIISEIRNPMTTVRGYLQLMGAKPWHSAKGSTFNLMISELDRANAIITEFLSLAQAKPTELKSQDLNDILNKLYPLLEADTFNQNKQISFIPGEIPTLQLNEKEIIQLVLNLTRNGLEAMEETGCLRVESYVEDGKVVLAIADEGCGIPAENLRKVGMPFFTTKDSGTGLGLATCYKIAESHNAKIDIKSNSRGTTFFVSFPILK